MTMEDHAETTDDHELEPDRLPRVTLDFDVDID
jgi:hypothetical protein